MIYVSQRGSITSLHLEFAELYSANIVIRGTKLWMVSPKEALDPFLKAVGKYQLSYPGCSNRRITCCTFCKNPGCNCNLTKSQKKIGKPESKCKNAKVFYERGRPCDNCHCRVAPFHESYIFPTQAFLDEHKIPRAFIVQEAGDLVIINSSSPHLVYNCTDCAAGNVLV